MVTISLPKSAMTLKRHILNCLECASSQGLNSDNTSVSVNLSEWISVKTFHREVKIASDLFNSIQPCIQCDFTLNYQNDSYNPARVSPSIIYIGVKPSSSEGFYVQDVWCQSIDSDIEGVVYSRTSTCNETNIRHFSWFISLISLGFSLKDSLVIARSATSAVTRVSRETSFNKEIDTAIWPTSYLDFPKLIERLPVIDKGHVYCRSDIFFPRISKESFGLYPVVDDISWIRKLLPLGVKMIQLRIKDGSKKDLEHQIIEAIKLGREYDVMVFINDHWRLAVKHGAFGVHLGQEDLERVELDRLIASGIHLGISSHGYYELLRAQSFKPSYVALGHIFATTTKQMPSQPQGLTKLKLYQNLINSIESTSNEISIPTVAIGGIDLSNVSDVMKCGVSCVAVVRAITLSESLQDDLEKFDKYQPLQHQARLYRKGEHDVI